MTKHAFFIGLVTLLVACSGKNNSELGKLYEQSLQEQKKPVIPHIDQQLKKVIDRYGLTGEPTPTSTTDIASTKAQLGKKLFLSLIHI